MMIEEDKGPPALPNTINGTLLPQIPVSIMIDNTARELGLVKEAMERVLHIASRYQGIPTRVLIGICTSIPWVLFNLNFLIMKPLHPIYFKALIGQPWLYKAKVIASWGKKEFMFEGLGTTVSWETRDEDGNIIKELDGYDTGLELADNVS